ncbi:hypothetical protein LC593_22690, partial [Nostoc sp. CHAB 5844]|nr:hypothetical protein [Nostoc sp. CHAB 5844]
MKRQQIHDERKSKHLNKSEVNHLASIFKELPDRELIQLVETQKQLERWLTSRGINYAVADCFIARTFKDNDPISHLKRKNKTGVLIHRMIWKSVDVHESNGPKKSCKGYRIKITAFKARERSHGIDGCARRRRDDVWLPKNFVG